MGIGLIQWEWKRHEWSRIQIKSVNLDSYCNTYIPVKKEHLYLILP